MTASHASDETATPPRAGKPRRRWLVWLRRVIITLIVIFIALIYVVFPLWASSLVTRATTRPMDRRLTSTPKDFQADYKDVEFTAADGVRLSGWLLASRERHVTIVFSHGLFRSRRELLERAVDLWRLGYGALLYDARNHGDSGAAHVTLGYDERQDAEAAVRFLRDENHTSDKIVLFGISMGAATALLAAAETPEVAAVISDSSYLNFKDTSDHHIRLFLHLPAFPLANEIRGLMQWRGKFDGDKLDALDAVRRLGDRPAMFIAAAHDPRMPPDIAEKLYGASAASKRKLLVIDGPGSEVHGHAYQADPQRYVSEVAAFLKDALSP
jgi:pimeloyl-ACP methyl ester carboxylesterase